MQDRLQPAAEARCAPGAVGAAAATAASAATTSAAEQVWVSTNARSASAIGNFTTEALIINDHGCVLRIGAYYPPDMSDQADWTRQLTGPGGWITMIMPAASASNRPTHTPATQQQPLGFWLLTSDVVSFGFQT